MSQLVVNYRTVQAQQEPPLAEITPDQVASVSKTFRMAMQLLPENRRDMIALLYAFVRLMDDCVDVMPANLDLFDRLHQIFSEQDGQTEADFQAIGADQIAASMGNFLIQACNMDKPKALELMQAFCDSMLMDLQKPYHESADSLDKYIYGSAEVIGLMYAAALGVDLGDNADMQVLDSAKSLGKAYQLINFLRDIFTDLLLGRLYLVHENAANISSEIVSELRQSVRHEISKFVVDIDYDYFLKLLAEQGLSHALDIYGLMDHYDEIDKKFSRLLADLLQKYELVPAVTIMLEEYRSALQESKHGIDYLSRITGKDGILTYGQRIILPLLAANNLYSKVEVAVSDWLQDPSAPFPLPERLKPGKFEKVYVLIKSLAQVTTFARES